MRVLAILTCLAFPALVSADGTLVGTASAVTVPGTVPEATFERRVGHAYRLATGELVYRIIHEPQVDGERLLADHVRYITPDGELIARKTIHFGDNPLVPAFRLETVRNGYLVGLEPMGGNRLELFRRDGEDAAIERAETTAPPGLVAEAGFDILINRHFDELKGGRTLRFPFAVPSQLRILEFRVQPVDRRDVLGEPSVVVLMTPVRMFIRLFVDPIHLAYHAETGALLRYEGPSPLPDPEHGDRYPVRVDFPPADVQPVAPEPTAPRGRFPGR